MNRAIELARHGVEKGDGGPFGCVIVRGDDIVGEGWNRVVAATDPTAHGEINAIRAAASTLRSFSLAGCEIFTTGEPCPMCLAAIHWARIERVVFAFTHADAAAIGFADSAIMEQLRMPRDGRLVPEVAAPPALREQALAVARAWFARPDRVHY
ncbi:MAG: nucleoside deaminase [Phycisphaerae bacterium]|nr:nucleoside deaminase [Phycisphaerae bacterium]